MFVYMSIFDSAMYQCKYTLCIACSDAACRETVVCLVPNESVNHSQYLSNGSTKVGPPPYCAYSSSTANKINQDADHGRGSRLLESLLRWMYTSVPYPSIDINLKSPPKYLAYCQRYISAQAPDKRACHSPISTMAVHTQILPSEPENR